MTLSPTSSPARTPGPSGSSMLSTRTPRPLLEGCVSWDGRPRRMGCRPAPRYPRKTWPFARSWSTTRSIVDVGNGEHAAARSEDGHADDPSLRIDETTALSGRAEHQIHTDE